MKAATNNEYQKAINKAIDYINEHLNEPIDLKKIAEVSCLSEFHFHRIFRAYIGESVGAYISRLRLEQAAQKLQVTDDTLTEIAGKTGYRSQQSLSKAFKKFFGLSPRAFKNIQNYFESKIPKPKVPNTLTPSEPQIREVERKKVIYTRTMAKYGSDKNYEKAWKRLWKYVSKNKFIESDSEYIGILFDDPGITKHHQCRYYACISISEEVRPEGEFGIYMVEGGRFAVFTLKGAYEQLHWLYLYIYFDWLPDSGYRLRDATPYEKYLDGAEKVKVADQLTEVYVPIQ